MRPLRLVAVAVCVLATVQLLEGSAVARVTGKCSRATANRLIATLPVADRVLPFYSRLTRAMCLDFDRDHRKDMVISMWIAMNHGAHYWAAYRAMPGNHWHRELFSGDCCSKRTPRNGGTDISLSRTGHDFIVSQPIFAPTDPACCPSGGIMSATWQWRRGRLRIVSRSTS